VAKTIKVDYLARVEGEGGLTIRFRGDRPTAVELRIFEPPRFFEAFLRGRGYLEAPDITARICGICPVAYQMSACHALEAALGLVPPAGVRSLRRLLYCGEWIESHALHVFLLHAPDFLGFEDAVAMAKQHRDVVAKALSIKKAGNAILRALGGREIHPINVRVGGFYSTPPRAVLEALVPQLEAAHRDITAALPWLASFDFPDFSRDYEFVALRHASEYPICEGRIASSRGLDIAVSDYGEHFVEQQVSYSTALHSVTRAGGAYVCGPLARFNLNFERLRPGARALAESIGLVPPVTNPFKGSLVRAIEIAYALEEALAIIAAYSPFDPAFAETSPRAGVGHGCTEAPRGILYHRYQLDEAGSIVDAKIVPPTSQNMKSIELDLFELAPELGKMKHADATWRAEQAVRNYDPCISCSTHFLRLAIERNP
jgi:coenzyme F420-reducing hydrogenase alpha subunit